MTAGAQQDEGPVLMPTKPVVKPVSPTLLVICDLACNWKLDGETMGHIDAGASAKVKVEIGQHLVVGATEDGLDKAQKEVTVMEPGQVIALIALESVRDARLKAEQDARDKAAREKADQEAKDKAAREKAEQEARDKAAREKADQEAKDKAAREKAEQDAKDKIALGTPEAVVQPPLASQKPAQPDLSSDPNAPHAPGIYMMAGAPRKMIPLEPRQISTKLIDFEVRVQLGGGSDGPEAKIRTADAQPEFYFYFDERGADTNPVSLGDAVSASDFMLLHFALNGEGRREAAMAKMGFTKFQNFNRDRVAVRIEKIGPAAYKVTLPVPLKAGEYGFISLPLATVQADFTHTTSAKDKTPSWLFDFGVGGGQ
jgi:hypothetical protein